MLFGRKEHFEITEEIVLQLEDLLKDVIPLVFSKNYNNGKRNLTHNHFIRERRYSAEGKPKLEVYSKSSVGFKYHISGVTITHNPRDPHPSLDSVRKILTEDLGMRVRYSFPEMH